MFSPWVLDIGVYDVYIHMHYNPVYDSTLDPAPVKLICNAVEAPLFKNDKRLLRL